MDEDKVGILLVDDDEAVRGLARIILAHEGWHIEEAGSLEEAFDRLRVRGFRPHLAVVDLCLPDGLGTELVDELRRARPKSKLIYITGDPGWLRRLDAGGDSVLSKPFTPPQLVGAVRSALTSIRPVVVIVEAGLVSQKLISSALVHENVTIVTASSLQEGILLARQSDAVALFTSAPKSDEAMAELVDLRRMLSDLTIIALATDEPRSSIKWYDRKLVKPFSAQSVADALRNVLNRRALVDGPYSKRSNVHQDGDNERDHN